MSPETFARAVHKLAGTIERQCSAETCDAIARLVESLDEEKVSRDDAIAITTELFLRLLPRRPARRR
jgi:hypothetical protein